MSRLTSDRNTQQQQQQQNIGSRQQQPPQQQQLIQPQQQNQNPQQQQQTLIQNIRNIPQNPQIQTLTIANSGSYVIINSNNNSSINTQDGGILRNPSNVVNTIINSNNISHNIYYSTPPHSSQSLTNQNLLTNVTTTASTPTSHIGPTSPIAKKRLKLEVADSSSSCSSVSNTVEDLAVLKKRILEHKLLRLKNLREKHSEHVVELFFLQSNGNMMEYPHWRKRSPGQQFIGFSKTYRLDQSLTDDIDPFRFLNQQTPLPQGAEIKIPGVGITPIAVSTQLPAAVAQLSQQGHIPGRPPGGRHGMVFGQISSSTIGNSSNTPLVPGGTPLVPDSDKKRLASSSSVGSTNGSASHNLSSSLMLPSVSGSNDQFSVKAKQEVYVIQRVQELQREGLWMEKRLPKLAEPQRHKVHWDFLLEEMQWLAQDFAQERKWKKAAAKKCARMVQRHFQDKQMAAQKAEKAQEQHLKRIAAFIAKEIKVFWTNVEKLVEFKQNTKLEEKRKKALDQQLSFIVEKTEKYSQQLAEGMNKAHASKNTSLNSSRISSPTFDDEFRPNEASDDDEETIAQAEAELPSGSTNEEIDALKKESEMDMDDFIKTLPKDYLANRDSITLDDGEDDFEADESSADDEDTIMEQEKKEKSADHKAEIDELNAENEMSIDELMAKYKSGAIPDAEELDSDDDSSREDEDEAVEDEEQEDSDEEMEVDESEEESDDEMLTNEEGDLKTLLDDCENKNKTNESSCDNNKDDLFDDVAALAESIQPKGNTLSSTSVVTPIPFLLKHTLREYQHIGLDWLVTMHDRKLNGILADEMGLGKTIQTISLLAHLACVRGNWGPHLIIVPSSVMLNWEMEFKKWCPGFKIMTYYGSQKERKMKRIGWTKNNAFHVCITSYKLVIQDHQSFRRKKWKYLILDEAQNIKNFKSQRWQLLLNFSSEQRLLLTGTPLQNNLMELWSLMHFLMPNVFQSHREFKEWFSNPMTGMIEGNSEYNESIIKRLHKVLRPFLLRRLKSEVEKQMPKKYEHVVMCRLSNRQRYLYDDFMSRAKTRETLASGNLLSVINVLMQLRKVCNHPNLFEVRPTVSPFRMDQIDLKVPSLVYNIFKYDPLKDVDLVALNLVLINLETCLTAFVAYRMKQLITPKKLIEEIDDAPDLPPVCPEGKCKLHLRIKPTVQKKIIYNSIQVRVGTSPALKSDGTRFVSAFDKKPKDMIIIDDEMNGSGFQKQTFQLPTTSNNTQSFNKFNNQVGQLVQIQTSAGPFFMLNNKNLITKSGSVVMLNQAQTAQTISKPFASALIEHVKQNPAQQITAAVPMDTSEDLTGEQSEFYLADKEELQREYRHHILQLLSKSNRRKCDAAPIYGDDVRSSLLVHNTSSKQIDLLNFLVRSHVTCNEVRVRGSDWSLAKTIKSVEQRTQELASVFNKFTLFVPAVSAVEPCISVSHMHPSSRNEEETRERVISTEMAPKTLLLHPIASAMTTQFPDPRLIQYDCGKLQALDSLLRTLKCGSHRVLIFTQMTRMLDVLEAFLNCHGHIYLRLDGTTKVEQRQLLMERFNEDKRIFVFILSTRSGGVGINLTGADTVVFYDSDWNPTMDAQAQDRCHRIGQTRDVHIYRLVSEKTIEENILKKANQKRLLGDLAIEGGNFTTAYFKNTTIQDLFNVDQGANASARLAEVVDRDKERREKLAQSFASTSTATSQTSSAEDKQAVGAFESALAAAEDDQDVEAATTAKAEAAEDLSEFDENIPITEDNREAEPSKAEKEVQNLIKQLSPIERYAMKFVEETEGTWTAIQLKAVEMEIEQQKREWEANRLAAMQQEELERAKIEQEDNELLTFSREDALNKIWISSNTMEQMPMWCPPTPPQEGSDLYIDYSLGFLYETGCVMNDNQLPAIYVKKEYKRTRTDDGFFMDGRRPLKMRKEDNYYAPRSLFDRPSPAIVKMRRDLKLQRNRGLIRSMPMANIKQQIPMKPLLEPEGMAEWLIFEDKAILNVIQNLQGLPLNLMLLCPGHTPNWDLVADLVNQTSRTYRSPKHCRWRYEAVIVPREEGKLLDSPKKQKKNKNPMKNSLKNLRTPRTAQLFQSDNNNSFTKLTKMKFDAIKSAMSKKAPQMKKYLGNGSQKNVKHLAVLNEFGINNYESAPSPIDIAAKCYERLTQERNIMQQKIDAAAQAKMVQKPQQQLLADQLQQSPIPSPLQQHQMVHSPLPMQQATIVVQAGNQMVTTSQHQQQAINALVHGTTMQGQRIQTQTINLSHSTASQQQQQLMKAIVASSPNVQTTQGLLQMTPQQQQQLQQHSQQNLMTSTVSVVLTAPTNVSTVQIAQPQMVSIQPTAMLSNASPIVSQATGQTFVQTLNSQGGNQGQTQVVSVSQLTGVGTVLTSTSLSANAQGTTLVSSPGLRQRIVTGQPGSLKEVVLHQRAGAQNPTVISVSGLGQSITQAQLKAAALKLSGNLIPSGLRISTNDKSLPAGTGKTTTGTPQFHFYRSQPVRQQLKVIPGGSGQSTTLVPTSGTIIQGGQLVQTVGQSVGHIQGGQKVTVATINSGQQQSDSGDGQQVATGSNVTVQVSGGGVQQRAQFIKQVTAAGKQNITRNVTDTELIMVKRQLVNPQQKGQLLTPQTQIYAPGNLQQQNSSGQQITTLVKTSGTVTGTPGQVGMTISQFKPGQVRATVSQNQVRHLSLPQTMNIGGQPRKGGQKMTQISQAPKSGIYLQPNSGGAMTIQQIQQVFRQVTPGRTFPQGIILGNPSGGVGIPVSVSQPNTHETLQYIPTTRAQILTGNLRLQGDQQSIKVSPSSAQQAAIIMAQRANNSVRLQTSGGSVVAVAVQQQSQQQSVQSQMTVDSNISPSTSQQTQQLQQVPNLTVNQPQQSPQHQQINKIQRKQ